ncbi:MAG TPA: type II toxin-antitoxin system PemK/MazF family toxin [Thermoanaerobaculia bacterium]|nr:type II toxin-antitoxin system PemK/MazF family toxin [Thermoanaerobaculia bacterium]
MEVRRGEVWWADLPDPVASSPGGTHPVLIVQANAFNRSRISTILAAVITSNTRLAHSPGNVLIAPRESGLSHPSVVNVSQLLTADREFLRDRTGRLEPETMNQVDHGLRLVLGLV